MKTSLNLLACTMRPFAAKGVPAFAPPIFSATMRDGSAMNASDSRRQADEENQLHAASFRVGPVPGNPAVGG